MIFKGKDEAHGHSYQMDIRHKVAKHSCCHSASPHPVGHNVKHTQVEELPQSCQEAAPLAASLPSGPSWVLRIVWMRTHSVGSHASSSRHQRFESQCQQSLDQHKDTENLKGPGEPQRFHQLVQENWQTHGEEAGPGRHHTVGQAQALTEVVAQNDQRGLEGEGGAAAKQYTVREIAKAQRPAV